MLILQIREEFQMSIRINVFNHLFPGSWDNNVRCWEIDNTGDNCNPVLFLRNSLTIPHLDMSLFFFFFL
jgi:hypothetical protein